MMMTTCVIYGTSRIADNVLNLCSLYFSQAIAQAGKDPGCIFRKRGDIEIEKIKQSKYFRSLFQQSCEINAYGSVWCAKSLHILLVFLNYSAEIQLVFVHFLPFAFFMRFRMIISNYMLLLKPNSTIFLRESNLISRTI